MASFRVRKDSSSLSSIIDFPPSVWAANSLILIIFTFQLNLSTEVTEYQERVIHTFMQCLLEVIKQLVLVCSAGFESWWIAAYHMQSA